MARDTHCPWSLLNYLTQTPVLQVTELYLYLQQTFTWVYMYRNFAGSRIFINKKTNISEQFTYEKQTNEQKTKQTTKPQNVGLHTWI